MREAHVMLQLKIPYRLFLLENFQRKLICAKRM
jgi:hypothetical protein